MKKLAALALVLVLSLALVSCKPNSVKDDGTVDLEPFKTAISATALTTATVDVTASNDVFPDEPLNAHYDIAYSSDGTVIIDYTYEEYNELSADGASVTVSTYSGQTTVSPSDIDTGDVPNTVVSAGAMRFNLDASKMTLSTSMGILTANIPAANTADVLGFAIGADVVLTISVANGAVTASTVSYTVNNVDYVIECSYN